MALLGGCVVAGEGSADGVDPGLASDPCAERAAGTLCLIAGVPGAQQFGPEGVLATESPLNLPTDAMRGPDGRLYVVDHNNHRIRAVDLDGIVHTVAGTGMLGDGVVDDAGIGQPGPADKAALNHPAFLGFSPDDPDGVWISAFHNARIDRLDVATNWVSFEAGDGTRAYCGDDGPAELACLDLPSGLAFAPDGALYLFDQGNHALRRIDVDGTIRLVGGVPREDGYAGDGGPVAEASFAGMMGKAADPGSGLDILGDRLVIADTGNQVIRQVDLRTGIISHLAGVSIPHEDEDQGYPALSGYSGDGGPARDARFAFPTDVAIAPDGTVFVADWRNDCVRAIDPQGILTTVAGVCTLPGLPTRGVPATESLLEGPHAISLGPDGELYVTSTYSHAIYVVWGATDPDAAPDTGWATPGDGDLGRRH